MVNAAQPGCSGSPSDAAGAGRILPENRVRATGNTHIFSGYTPGTGSPILLGTGVGARGENPREYRVQAAETVAQLAERGMLDTQLLGEELAYLLKNQWVPTNRVVQALKDTASISPLAGWRTLQVLVEVLPVVGRVNRGGVLVQLLAELAGEYGVSVSLPESLRPALKGTTLLAKNLRALSALDTHPSGLAEQANQQALALMTEGGA